MPVVLSVLPFCLMNKLHTELGVRGNRLAVSFLFGMMPSPRGSAQARQAGLKTDGIKSNPIPDPTRSSTSVQVTDQGRDLQFNINCFTLPCPLNSPASTAYTALLFRTAFSGRSFTRPSRSTHALRHSFIPNTESVIHGMTDPTLSPPQRVHSA